MYLIRIKIQMVLGLMAVFGDEYPETGDEKRWFLG